MLPVLSVGDSGNFHEIIVKNCETCFLRNLPFGLASGLGLSAYLVYGLVLGRKLFVEFWFVIVVCRRKSVVDRSSIYFMLHFW